MGGDGVKAKELLKLLEADIKANGPIVLWYGKEDCPRYPTHRLSLLGGSRSLKEALTAMFDVNSHAS